MLTKNRKNARKLQISNNCKFIKFFKSKFAQAPFFLLLSNLLCFLQLKKTHDFFSSNLVKMDLDLDLDPEPDLDPDPHSEKLLDPDPHKMNADPQPWVNSTTLSCRILFFMR